MMTQHSTPDNSSAFHEVSLPSRIAFGSTGGPERRTEVVQLASGFEQRNTPWAQSRRRYNITAGPRPVAELYALMAFFEARQGRLYGFRWHDWLDYQSAAPGMAVSPSDQPCRQADAERRVYHLQKTYGQGAMRVVRRIHKPCADSVKIAINGRALQAGDFSVDITTGIVELNTPAPENAKVTAGFHFDVPVRFDTDYLDIEFTGHDSGRLNSLPLIELRISDETSGDETSGA